MFKKHFAKTNVSYKKKSIDEPEKVQQVAQMHRCALNWCDRCAFCEFGYDELKQKLLSAEVSSDDERALLRKKTEELSEKINGELLSLTQNRFLFN